MADATGGADQSHDKMLARNRFLLLVVVGGAALAVISLSLQFYAPFDQIPISTEDNQTLIGSSPARRRITEH
ncbi:hypothetical protein F2P81_017395 [Scophthalmus maximus]|uniref:Uncharacterized protein n=1 Tax=Scophthalmus maximus TaxID=52904 RepID=A0A6A4SI72_SCOMX|nr:hypothetical protein F2P81_017395 [Scophthalmus maximus]